MNDDQKQAYATTMIELQMKCQGELSREKLAAYWQDLREYSFEQVQVACRQLGTQPGRIFFPAVGEFISVLKGSAKGNAQEAWQHIYLLINSVNPETGEQYHSNNPPSLSDPRAAKALQIIGGFKSICLSPLNDLHWLQKRFAEAYETADSSMQREQVQQIGHSEAKGVLGNLNQRNLLK